MWAPMLSTASSAPAVSIIAIELARHNVRVNILSPGAFATRLVANAAPEIRRRTIQEIPLRREGRVDELVATALLLLSDALSPYSTTGADVIVDSGLHSAAPHFQWR